MPRYYNYGYQGSQYAGQQHPLAPRPTQAPGLRYGLGDSQPLGLWGSTSIQRIMDKARMSVVKPASVPVLYTATMFKANHTKTCTDTGMPGEMVTECVRLLKLGVPMSKVMPQLQSDHAAASSAAEAASASSAAAPVGPVAGKSNTKKMLLVGGIAAGGALALFLILRKKK